MSDLSSLLQPLKDRLAAATPGPLVAEHRNQLDWLSSSPYINSDGHQAGSMIHQGDKGNPIWGSTWPHRNAQATADLFAAAPTDQAKLIAAIEAVESLASRTVNAPIEYSAGYLAQDILAALTQALGGDTA